jgi:hypothetical protein
LLASFWRSKSLVFDSLLYTPIHIRDQSVIAILYRVSGRNTSIRLSSCGWSQPKASKSSVNDINICTLVWVQILSNSQRSNFGSNNDISPFWRAVT